MAEERKVISVVRMRLTGIGGTMVHHDTFSCMYEDGGDVRVKAADELEAYQKAAKIEKDNVDFKNALDLTSRKADA